MTKTFFALLFLVTTSFAQYRYESGMYFRVEAGSRTCFYERGVAGQMLEAQYQVIDGYTGDLDISFDLIDPAGKILLLDHKRTENVKIIDLEEDGDYAFCLDNSHSLLNSKLVYIYVLFEEKPQIGVETTKEADLRDQNEEEEILEWTGLDENGQEYFVEVSLIADSMTRTLMHVVKARHLMDLYATLKYRDSYMALSNTLVVDAWSMFQITFMITVGTVQVYMIKKLFNNSVLCIK